MNRISEIYKGVISTPEARTLEKQRIRWVCDRVQGNKVLDVGCSQGIVPILLARESYKVTGLDIDSEAIAYAEADLNKEPPETRQNLAFIRGSIFETDLPFQKYDTAIMGNVLDHLVNPSRAIAKVYPALTNGGKLIITSAFGFGLGKMHRQTFYLSSMYKLLYPYFEIEEAEVIMMLLCLVCRKRDAIIETNPDSMDMALVEKQEQEFMQREHILLAMLAKARALDKALDTTHRSLSFRVGNFLVRTALLPHRLLRRA